MLPDIHEHSRMHIKDIIQELDNETSINNNAIDNDFTAGLFDDEVSSEDEDQDENDEKKKNDKPNHMKFSFVDRQFMSMFAFEVKFDGEVDEKKYVECKKGNIYCTTCAKTILNQDLPIKKLIKWGANIMQHHLLDDISYLGFATSGSS